MKGRNYILPNSLLKQHKHFFGFMILGSREREREEKKTWKRVLCTYNILLERCVSISRCSHDICSNVILLILLVFQKCFLLALGLIDTHVDVVSPVSKKRTFISSLCKVVWRPTIYHIWPRRNSRIHGGELERSKRRNS